MTHVVENNRYKWVPAIGFAVATTVLDGLVYGRALLAEEGHWTKGTIFINPQPQDDPTTPYCNGWGACAVGGLFCAILGIGRKHSDCDIPGCDLHLKDQWSDDDFGDDMAARDVYTEACKLLDDTARVLSHGNFSSVVQYNDHDETTHAQVLMVYDVAILVARAVEVTKQQYAVVSDSTV